MISRHSTLRLTASAVFALSLAACDQAGSASSSGATPAASASTSAPAASATPAAPAPVQVAQAPEAATATQATAPATTPAATPAPAAPVEAEAPAAPAVQAAAVGGPLMADAPLGSPEAKVTVIEYASLSCPHCAVFQTQTAAAFKAKYVDSGLVQFIYRDFPLNDSAMIGSLAARCDGSPQKYHAFIDLLMRQQDSWAFQRDGQSIVREVKRIAQLGGVSGEKLDACFENAELGQWILDTARQGESQHDVNSTPTFVINGKTHPGALSLADLSAAIDPLLK
ncbi:DsbA family protein [Neomegalonema sp.]|uniref:DsbA family protein n=1 Tax=Neomegalonema sp. TaxID=2039713 RepID=UPI002601EB88|nr:DsbA family protein [Neomegalonema sp.]MDD2869078.1 DsbA family protein [Neomegalonema sp.]